MIELQVSAPNDQQIQELHDLLLAAPLRPQENTERDRLLQHIAFYQQARHSGDYAVLAELCWFELRTPDLRADLLICYSWLAWLAQQRANLIALRQ